MDVLLVEELTYPVLLCKDVPLFHILGHQASKTEEKKGARPGKDTSCGAMFPLLGPMAVEDRSMDLTFQAAQEPDASLTHLWDNPMVDECKITNARAAQWFPYVFQEREVLWRVVECKGGPADRQQLIVPQRYQRQVLPRGHSHP